MSVAVLPDPEISQVGGLARSARLVLRVLRSSYLRAKQGPGGPDAVLIPAVIESADAAIWRQSTPDAAEQLLAPPMAAKSLSFRVKMMLHGIA